MTEFTDDGIDELVHSELTSGEILSKYIHKGQTVVVMGPSAGIADDASFLTVACLLGRNGRLLVVDPKSATRSVQIDSREKGHVRGAGNIDLHIRQLTHLYNRGMDIAVPTWVGPTGTCASTTLPDACCDVIVDHGTSPFVTASENRDEQRSWLEKIYQEYFRILRRPNGLLLLQASKDRYNLGEGKDQISLDRILKRSGYSVKSLQVSDKFRIPLTVTDAESLRTVPIEAEVFDKITHNIKSTKGGKFYFERSASQSPFVVSHKSNTMFIGTTN